MKNAVTISVGEYDRLKKREQWADKQRAVLARVKLIASDGLDRGVTDGATEWRGALEKILVKVDELSPV